MQATVPTLSMAFMAADILLGIAVPLAMYLFFRKKYACGRLPFFVGCAVMLVFAFGLEQLAHSLVFNSSLGLYLTLDPWLYALYGGFMAGLFEETGRYAAFRALRKKYGDNDRNALMYGAGHGGFEMFVILSISMVNNLVYSVLLNTGNTAALTAGMTDAQLSTVQSAFAQLTTTAPAMFLVSPLERFAALIAQLSLSVLVWFAAKKGGRFPLYLLAIALHMVLDAGAVLLSRFTSNILLVELAVWAFAGLCALIAARVWKKNAGARQTDGAPLPDAGEAL